MHKNPKSGADIGLPSALHIRATQILDAVTAIEILFEAAPSSAPVLAICRLIKPEIAALCDALEVSPTN